MTELEKLIQELLEYFNAHYLAIPPDLWEILKKIKSELEKG